ncbi:hypothetical protein V492_00468 [Pseudogymnoascus sp. VKM F-4246]|nr:hypothetical protein V492_00468 [Pseudogymnoascus sp. VKM F-4246]
MPKKPTLEKKPPRKVPERPAPRTVKEGLTITTEDGRVLSRNHPNPKGKEKKRNKYRSLKDQRINLLPKAYLPEDRDPQNGSWQCPVVGCNSTFTRKSNLQSHMQRPGGHGRDALLDNGDGTFVRAERLNDMRDGHPTLNAIPAQGYAAQDEPKETPDQLVKDSIDKKYELLTASQAQSDSDEVDQEAFDGLESEESDDFFDRPYKQEPQDRFIGGDYSNVNSQHELGFIGGEVSDRSLEDEPEFEGDINWLMSIYESAKEEEETRARA